VLSAEGVGKYAIKFHWSDAHEMGIYSWQCCATFVRAESAARQHNRKLIREYETQSAGAAP